MHRSIPATTECGNKYGEQEGAEHAGCQNYPEGSCSDRRQERFTNSLIVIRDGVQMH